MTDIALALRYGAPHLPPESVTVEEGSLAKAPRSVDGSDWFVTFTALGGIEVRIHGDVFGDLIERPNPCTHHDPTFGYCPRLVDPNGPDDGRCDIHETTRRGDLT